MKKTSILNPKIEQLLRKKQTNTLFTKLKTMNANLVSSFAQVVKVLLLRQE